MTRAEERALEIFPVKTVFNYGLTCNAYSERDTNPDKRALFCMGYEQAEKDILKIVSQITADLWGAPCNYSPLDEEICLCPNTPCDKICGTPEASDAGCWEMYFKLKIAELNKKV